MQTKINELLLERLESGEDKMKQIDERLWREYGHELAVFISDMSGFSRITRERGILHFLSLIAKQRELALPVIARHSGRLIKTEADNIFAVFDDPADAVRTSGKIHAILRKFNETRDEVSRVIACHGISFGRVLDFGDDVYGNPVNMASKLGEDVAEPYDTLVTAEVHDACRMWPEFEFEERHVTISGVDIEYYRLIWRR